MKSGRPVIYWDTCVFIAWLKDEKDKWPPAVWQGIQDVADLVNFIRSSWGNSASAMSAGEVAVVRKAVAPSAER